MQYRKKPVAVDAILWDGKAETLAEIVGFCLPRKATLPLDTAKLTIETLEGNMIAEVGDMIIKGVNGECYPCKPDIFAKTYEPASSPSAGSPDWVSVEEGLPGTSGDDDADVLVYGCKFGKIENNIAGHCMIASWNGRVWRDDNDTIDIEDNSNYWQVTHWHPLPAPPNTVLDKNKK